MKNRSYNNFFTNFANKTRFKIIMLLRKKSLNVNSICKEIKEEQSKVSHNLRTLVRCHILNVKKKGKERIYSINKSTINPLFKVVENHVRKCCLKRCKR